MVIPLIVDGIWCAYMLEMQTCKLNILEAPHNDDRLKLHQHAFALVHVSLNRCLDSIYTGWTLNPLDEWEVNYPTLCGEEVSR